MCRLWNSAGILHPMQAMLFVSGVSIWTFHCIAALEEKRSDNAKNTGAKIKLKLKRARSSFISIFIIIWY